MKRFLTIILALAVCLSSPEIFASGGGKNDKNKKGKITFKVRIENVSNADGLMNTSGSKYPFALSPGMFLTASKGATFFKAGERSGDGLEAQAEDGNPAILADMFKDKFSRAAMGIFNVPVGAEKPAPILPGGAFEFEFAAVPGMRLDFVTMFGQSNDLFYAPEKAIKLFENGVPISGDITDKLMLWDAGTEVNQEPGTGADQAPRQKSANTGASENGVVKQIEKIKDGFVYPATKDVLRVTIKPQS